MVTFSGAPSIFSQSRSTLSSENAWDLFATVGLIPVALDPLILLIPHEVDDFGDSNGEVLTTVVPLLSVIWHKVSPPKFPAYSGDHVVSIRRL